MINDSSKEIILKNQSLTKISHLIFSVHLIVINGMNFHQGGCAEKLFTVHAHTYTHSLDTVPFY